MKVCPKCGTKYENGNFCENCETEDGKPVRLEEQKISCPQCGKLYPAGTKFCSDCGVKLGASSPQNNAGISMGDKNVVAGDVIGKKDETNISGNATIIKNEAKTFIDNTVVHNEVTNNSTTNIIHNDETTATSKCSVCGKIIKRIEGYECTKCGKFVCSDCYDDSEKMCTHCSPFTSAQKVSKALEKFVNELLSYNVSDNTGWSFVEHYIIPNNKNDIKEFLVYCSSQRDALRSDDNKLISVLWNNKCLQLINQGEVAFPDDKLFQDFLKEKKTNSEAFKEKIRKENEKAIEKERKRKLREENREKRIDIIGNIISFFSVYSEQLWWFFIVCIDLLMILFFVLGIRSCNHKINAKRNIESIQKEETRNSIEQKVAEIQNSNPQHGIIITKDNVVLEGYIRNYMEVVEDGVITFLGSSTASGYDVCFTTKLKKKKSFLGSYEEQEKSFRTSTSMPKDKTIQINEDYLSCNLIGREKNYFHILANVKNDKIGDVVTVSMVNKVSDASELLNFLRAPNSSVIISSNPYFYYDGNKKKIE